MLLKKISYIFIFSAGIKSNNLSYFAPSLRILFSVLIIVFPPYLQYIAFSLIPTPSSSIATIFFIVASPGRNKNIDLQNLRNVHDMLGNFTVTCFYATFSYSSILRFFLFSLC